ncbi:MAG: hypothetical protein ACKV22_01230 [Bryobacteraceae bacterium]
MFTARTVFVESRSADSASYELVPASEEAQRVCGLFLEFLAHRPPQFRERLAFVTRGDYELDWNAAPGGAAFAAIYQNGEPLSMGVLLSGVHPEVDDQMLSALRSTVLEMAVPAEAGQLASAEERPLLLNVVFPGSPESTPALQLLTTALASVYFRCIHQIHREEN